VIEINKDVGGPTVKQMLDQYRKVLEKKRCLLIWGELSEDEVLCVLENLPLDGVYFNILPSDIESAERLNKLLFQGV
jgi:hypothetical protein